MNENNTIELEVQLNRVIFKKDSFQILSLEVVNDKLKGHIITAKGTAPTLEYGMKYKLIAKTINDPKYGQQYQIISLSSNYDLKDGNEQKKFLSFFLTGNQLNNLFSIYLDPLPLLENKDIPGLCKVKGITPQKACKIIEAYEANKDNSVAYIKLHDYGLTKVAIDKLVETYGTPEVVVEKVTSNPYILIEEVKGYGWSKADAIALNSGTPPTSKFRLSAFAKYYLDKCANDNGHTWIDLQELRNAYFDVIPEATDEHIRETLKILTSPLFDKPSELIFHPENNKICLRKYKVLEENIARELKRLKKGTNLSYESESFTQIKEDIENMQGWTFTEEQLEATQMILNNPVSIITGPAGCVDCDTEFFNGMQWKKISEWTPSDKVLQYNKDGSTELVTPLRYIKQEKQQLWHFKTKYGLDQCLSDNHEVYYITSKGNLYHKQFSELKCQHEKSKYGFNGGFLTSFKYNGTGINLSNAEIKLMCAVICDGAFNNYNTNYCRFHIKKDRKKIELLNIFKECGLSYKEHNSAAKGYTDYYIYTPIKTKIFTPEWYNCTQEQLQIICNNILFWDGSVDNIGRKRFSTTIKENADFVQFAFSACGYRASITINDRKGQEYVTNNKIYKRISTEYNINITNRNVIGMTSTNTKNKIKIEPYKTLDGYEYCFTVPSHMWIMRRNGKIVITGNCGKTSSLQLATAVLKKSHCYGIAQTALSGRAASRMSEVTGLPGSTIHRLLGINPETGIAEIKSLSEQVIILDETSMVDGYIFLKLIKAIPTGHKFVMLGDINQLESIGLCNLLKDMIHSNTIPYRELKTIHRQAAKSGIITTATKVRNGEQIIPSIIWEGETVVGEMQDLKMIGLEGNLYTQEVILDNYKKLLNQKISKDDIDVIVPMRKRGNICLNTLNKKIQDIVANKSFNYITVSGKTKDESEQKIIYEQDRIIVTENCYKGVYDEKGNEVAIFNGNIGKVVSISEDGDTIEVDLTQQGRVTIPACLYRSLDLGYAITCHAKQGSETPYAIIGLDSSCYALMSKEWLYTAITRAKKYCILVGQNSMLHKAVQVSSVSKKQTWLQEMLNDNAV